MIGFAEADATQAMDYGLIGEHRHAQRDRQMKIAAAALGLLALISLATRSSSTTATAALSLLAEGEISADAPCPTLPFHQCAGLNFTAGGTGYNFSKVASQTACCPVGTSCVVFGPVRAALEWPSQTSLSVCSLSLSFSSSAVLCVTSSQVWGMCMPDWSAKKPAPASSEAAIELAMAGFQLELKESKAKEKAKEEEKKEEKMEEKEEEKEEEKPAAADAPCPTLPFHQCAGLNFTAGGTGYNFSKVASQTACCPVGTSCVVFGPVWGMCMPSWGKPTATASAYGAVAVYEDFRQQA